MIDWWKLLELLGALAIGALGAWRWAAARSWFLTRSALEAERASACLEVEHLVATQDWAALQIDERLLDVDAQLEVAQRRLASTILVEPAQLEAVIADVQALIHDARQRGATADVIAIAIHDGRIAAEIGPDGTAWRFDITEEPVPVPYRVIEPPNG